MCSISPAKYFKNKEDLYTSKSNRIPESMVIKILDPKIKKLFFIPP
jgi:hypothetical protein